MSDSPPPAAASVPPAGPPADASGLPPLPKPEEITSVTQLFGLLRGRLDYERTLREIRRERDEWDSEGDGDEPDG